MALPTIATAIYSCLSLKLLKALAESNGNLFAIAIAGRKITLERAIKKRSNEQIPVMKQRRLRAITFLGAIEKRKLNNWMVPQLFRILVVTIIFFRRLYVLALF